MNDRCAVLIPAYQPDGGLPKLVIQLRQANLPVLIIDDGSTGCEGIFAKAEAAGAIVLHHAENHGKGAAMKTGFAWLVQNGYTSAVTADADGQHSCADILRICKALEACDGKLVLGARDVSKMPPRSKAGNSLTRALFRLLYGIVLQDTQTGLRGIPLAGQAKALLALPGDRYEYEMNMLIHSPELFSGIEEIPIETIYMNRNESSHFRPLADGLKIYALLLRHFPKFLITSLASFLVDYSLFALFFYQVFHAAFWATIVARALSACVNYLANKHFVFQSSSAKYTPGRYFLLAISILAVNSLLMYLLVDCLHLPAMLIKILVESTMYLVSFSVQSRMAHKDNFEQKEEELCQK